MKKRKIRTKKLSLKNHIKGRAAAFIDYANIKSWAKDKNLFIDLQILYAILRKAGVNKIFFYYGTDLKNPSIFGFFNKLRSFGFEIITKPVKYLKISLLGLLNKQINQQWLEKLRPKTRKTLITDIEKLEKKGVRLFSPKANFDVEIALDMVLFKDKFDTFILFSGDSDFIPIVKYLKSKGKKIIIVSGKKYLAGDLAEVVDYFLFLDELQYQIKGLLIKKPRSAKRIWKNCKGTISCKK